MNKLKLHIIIFCLVFSNIAVSQEFEVGKVSRQELEEKTNAMDTSAVATYLIKNRKTYFEYLNGQGFQLKTEIFERIKIYDQAGFEYATHKVKLYKNGSDRERLMGLKAYTYNLDKGNIIESKLAKEGEFSTELNENWIEESFTMPNLKLGSIIEYKYSIASPFISNVDEFVFQHNIPIRRLDAKIEVPEYFNFRINSKGYLNIVPQYKNQNRTLNIQNRVARDANGISGRTQSQSATINYKSTITSYELNNVPALREEPFVNGIDNYRAGMKYELSYVSFPDSPVKKYATDWEAVVKSIYENTNFGDELNRTGYYENEIEEVLRESENNEQKIWNVFNFVKSKVKWNGFFGKYTSDGVKKAYKDHIGNIAEINLMLTSMLRYVGLDANPVLVSTRENGIPLFPTREGYNYVISAVQLDGETILLDASHSYSTPDVLPMRVLNWEGRIIKKDGTSSLVSLYPRKNSSQKFYLDCKIGASGDLNGKIRIINGENNALSYRERYKKGSMEDYLRSEEKRYGEIEIDGFELKNENELSKPTISDFDFYQEHGVEVIGDKIYFSPLLFFVETENPFKLEKREFPIDFGYPSSNDHSCTIRLPEGYTVENLPQSIALAIPDRLGSFSYQIVQKDNYLQLKVISEINQSVIPATYYQDLKEYYKKMIEKMNEKVVLTKV